MGAAGLVNKMIKNRNQVKENITGSRVAQMDAAPAETAKKLEDYNDDEVAQELERRKKKKLTTTDQAITQDQTRLGSM